MTSDKPGEAISVDAAAATFEALYAAIAADDVGAVTRMIDLVPAARSQPARDGMPPLTYAAAKGAPHVLALLLDRGEDVNERDGALQTPLLRALQAYSDGQLEIVSRLLAAGADPNVAVQGELSAKSAIYLAAEKDSLALVGKLLDAGVRLHVSADDLAKDGGWSRLMSLRAINSPRMVDFLLDHGADPDRCAGPRTVIAANALRRHDAAALRLIERGVGVKERTKDGQSALDELVGMLGGGYPYVENVALALVNAGALPSRPLVADDLPDDLCDALAARGFFGPPNEQQSAEQRRQARGRLYEAKQAAAKTGRRDSGEAQRQLIAAVDGGWTPPGAHRYVIVDYDWEGKRRQYLSARTIGSDFGQQLRALGRGLDSLIDPEQELDARLRSYLDSLRDRDLRQLAQAVMTSSLEFHAEGASLRDDDYLRGIYRRYPGARVMCGWSAVEPLADIAFTILRLPTEKKPVSASAKRPKKKTPAPKGKPKKRAVGPKATSRKR